jgi:hypothetical protein
MPVLIAQQRKLLDDACVKGRRASEQAVRAALGSLAVTAERPPAHLSEEERQLRRGLRAKARQLGDQGDKLDLLIGECAYEQWHRLLFSRFLAENDLLIHPDYRAPVTLEDCEELADSLGEPDGWAVAGRFAAEILPGIFRPEDPCVRLRLAPEGRLALERILASLDPEILRSDDALGWVYQYWQREPKDEVNDSERKVGGADIGPVTQLFTEHYMVRFLLENSLGAWWIAHHPESSLRREWKYVRTTDDGLPAAGVLGSWPATAAKVTVIDPCCGSGHFLVEAFSMLAHMRAEEEHLSLIEAQDAVLRDNIFGLELDPRCVQLAMFGVALEAWKSAGGWRPLPVPNIACSGIPVRAKVDDWKAVAGEGDPRIETAVMRLHTLFREADTLGSLIDPRRATQAGGSVGSQSSLDDIDWTLIEPLLSRLADTEASDPAVAVLGASAAALARAARLLSQTYTLCVTNPPFLKRGSQTPFLREHNDSRHPHASADLATAMLSRWRGSAIATAFVLPSSWTYQSAYKKLRVTLLKEGWPSLIAPLGAGAFEAISGEIVNVALTVGAGGSEVARIVDVREYPSAATKAAGLATATGLELSLADALTAPDSRIVLDGGAPDGAQLLGVRANGYIGFQSGDNLHYRRNFWEVSDWSRWQPLQSTFEANGRVIAGCDEVIDWRGDGGHFAAEPGSRMQGVAAWGKSGVAVSLMGELRCSLYHGYIHDNSTGVVIPNTASDLPAVWAFMQSSEYPILVRRIDRSLKVNATSLVKVPFDLERWRSVAEESVPKPWSDDPTQWVFGGRPEVSTAPLQVAVARLVGYRWPAQLDVDELDQLADSDGIVCLPSVRGERTGPERLHELLARSFGGTWSAARSQELLAASGSKKRNLDAWLRDDFFSSHCQVFKQRPFIWQVWDGRKDGFSALVNYPRLDRPTLEKLAYSYLGDWIERQAAGVRDDVAGAEERLAAARALQQKLELVLGGEPPYDIYVRWKSLAEQPIGWEPDSNDGVRMNIRPFVEAGVLRSKVSVKWEKDRGKNPGGADRLNNLHYTNAQKQAARGTSS